MESTTSHARERLVRVLAGATFFVFFQAFMVAPILPRLASELGVSVERVGAIVPAYLLPYGLATLGYGVLSDRLGRRPLILASLVAFAVLTALTATATSAWQLLAWRTLTGVGASAIVPLSLALIGQTFPDGERGRPLGWLFGAMAGGMAFGSTFGAVLVPLIGWRGLFLSVGVAGAAVLAVVFPLRHMLGDAKPGPAPPFAAVLRSFREVVGSRRGARTYTFVFLNAVATASSSASGPHRRHCSFC